MVVQDAGGATTSDLTSVIVITPALPLSDNVADAAPVQGIEGDGSGNNNGAGRETNEPEHHHGRVAQRSVWPACLPIRRSPPIRSGWKRGRASCRSLPTYSAG